MVDGPIYLIQGANEADGRAVLADEWFALLDAPAKEMIVLDTSAIAPSSNNQPSSRRNERRRLGRE